jgi:hypothetical protein
MLRSKISMSVSAALLLGVVSITGCGTNNTAGNNVHTKSVRTHDGRLSVNSVRGTNQTRNFDKMEMSQKLADRVAGMPEVRSANVMLAGKTAYVAVTLDRSTSTPNALGTGRYGARSSSEALGLDGTRTPGLNGTMTGRTGTDGGMYGTGLGTGMGGSAYTPGLGARGTYNPGLGTTGTGNGALGTGRNMAGNGGVGAGTNFGGGNYSMRGTDTYNDRGMSGLGTTNTATPGRTVKLDEDSVTKEIKDKIAAEIKKTSPNIDAVYVSANPDFVERFNVYAEEARAGHPLRGFADEFRTMVERIFPTRNY